MHHLEPPTAGTPSQGCDFAKNRFQPRIRVSALSPALRPCQELEKSLGEVLHPCPPLSCVVGPGTGVGSVGVAAELAGLPPVPRSGRGAATPSLQSLQCSQHFKSPALQCCGKSLGPGFPSRNEIHLHLNGPTSPFALVSPVASTATAPVPCPRGTTSPQHH